MLPRRSTANVEDYSDDDRTDSNKIKELQQQLEERNKERQEHKELLKALQDNLDKKTTEKNLLKDQLREEKHKLDAETKQKQKLEKMCTEYEQKLEAEMMRRIELQNEILNHEHTEESLKQEIKKAQTVLYEDIDQEYSSSSLVQEVNKQLENDLIKMRKWIESVTLERDIAITEQLKLTHELELLRERAHKMEKDKQVLTTEKESLFEEMLQQQKKLQYEIKDKKEAEHLRTTLLDYKTRIQSEWEEKMKIEAQFRSVERELLLLKKSAESRETKQISMPETVDKDNLIQDLRHKLAILQQTNEEQQQQISELNVQLQQPYGNLKVKYVKLQRAYVQQQQQLSQLQDQLKEELLRRNELLTVKVKLEGMLKKQQERQIQNSSPSVLRGSSKQHTSLTPVIKIDSTRLKNIPKEDLQVYIQELVTKIEEQAISMLQFEQENQELKLQLASKLESEARHAIDLQKAKAIIEQQQKEVALKTHELEDTRTKLIHSFMPSARAAEVKVGRTRDQQIAKSKPA